MLILGTHPDGSVSTFDVFPTAAIYHAPLGDIELKVLGQRRRDPGHAEAQDKKAGDCLIYCATREGTPIEIRVGPVDFNQHDLRPDSTEHVTWTFPTAMECAAKWTATDRPIASRVITKADLPNRGDGDEYRLAWKDDGKAIGHDMVKAKEIHRDLLRRERSPKLDQLDTEFLRAIERADAEAQATIASQKQELRDITDLPAIEAAVTIDDLKAIRLPE